MVGQHFQGGDGLAAENGRVEHGAAPGDELEQTLGDEDLKKESEPMMKTAPRTYHL